MTTIARLMLQNPLIAPITHGGIDGPQIEATPPASPASQPSSPTPNVITADPSATSPASHCRASQQNCDTDSGKSSCSPALLDCSFDSGIGGVIDANEMQLRKRIQQCQRILMALKRQTGEYHDLRERLGKIAERKSHKESERNDKYCNVCCADIDPDDVRSYVLCVICKKHLCRGAKCANWHPKTSTWECQLCESSKESLAQTSSWVAEQLSFNQHKLVYPMRARSEIYIPIGEGNDSSIQFESVSQIGIDSAAITAEQKVKIREYVEEVVAQMLGGSLDSTAVSQLSKSETYLPAIFNGRQHLSATPTTTNGNVVDSAQDEDDVSLSHISQARLRQLIEGIIAETVRLPTPLTQTSSAVSEIELDTRNGKASPLSNGVGRRHRTEHYFEPSTYQDLLATAVLNKIVDKTENGSNRRFSESTPDLSGRLVDTNYNVENQSTTSGSSVEPRSDCSFTDTEQLLHSGNDKDISPFGSHRLLVGDKKVLSAGRESALSDYIATHMVPLPDLSAPVTESEEDDYVSETCSTIGEGTWEDNWLFKKKRTSASISSSSVGMLVPAPKEDVRAQIGDKTADEISDLSEMGSDSDDLSLDLMRNKVIEPVNDRLLNKHLIGGKNTQVILDDLYDRASMISTTPLAENEPKYTETKNIHVVDGAMKTEAINPKITTAQIEMKSTDTNAMEEDTNGNPPSGSIAEREYKKWNNAVDMPNNPYAPDALKRRISGSQERFIDLPNISPTTEQNPISQLKEASTKPTEDQVPSNDCKRYSRDYYINDAKQSMAAAQRRSCTAAPITNISDDPSTDHITINEVIRSGHSSSRANSTTLSSASVRRSSSLRFLNNNHHNYYNATSPHSLNSSYYDSSARSCVGMPASRCSTSASRYRDDDDNDDEDARSLKSWKSAATAGRMSTLSPARRTSSMHSSYASGLNMPGESSRSRRQSGASRTCDNNVLSQFEKQLLQKDLKRNSFRAISATTKDFVMNPLYDQEKFFGANGEAKLSLSVTPTSDEQVDSGVDSCLNGFSENGTRTSRNSLLF